MPTVSAKSRPESLSERYHEVVARLKDAAARAGNQGQQIVLCAVTKYASPEQIRELIELGHRDFGENRVQQLVQRAAVVDEYFSRLRVLPNARKGVTHASEELISKFDGKKSARAAAIAGAPRAADGKSEPISKPVRWHMIGHLQRNKAKKVADCVRLIHSVDSLRLAEELQAIGLRKDTCIEVLVQVNCSGESQKFGCPVPAAIPLVEQIETMMNVRCRGLMTMAALDASPEETRATFSRCRDLYDEVRRQNLHEGRFNLLSMGMSNDFELAIAEGANLVRVGSAIFGDPTPEQIESAEAED